jgi:apoptosis-inducing factor 3
LARSVKQKFLPKKFMVSTETTVAKINDLKDGKKQLVKVGESEVLLIRQNGIYSAIAAHCTHYKAASSSPST